MLAWLYPLLGLLGAAAGLTISTLWQVDELYDTYHSPGRIVTVEGVPTYVLERGEGETIVLIHGIGGSSNTFELGIFGPLSEQYHVIAVDRPGFGLSARPEGMTGDPREQAAFLHETLKAIGVNSKPLLLGQSWGASVAVAYALLYPDELRGIVFESPYLTPGHGVFDPLYDLAEPPLLSHVALYTVGLPASQHARRVFARLLFYPDPVPGYWFGDRILMSQTPHEIRMQAADMRTINQALEEMAPRYDEIDVPVAMIVGLSDRIQEPMPALQVAHSLGWRTVELPHTGHAVQMVATDTVLAVIRDMMR